MGGFLDILFVESRKRDGEGEGMKKDEESQIYLYTNSIKPRRHGLSLTPAGRTRYPFKKMIINDFFVIESLSSVTLVRSAIQSFHRRYPERGFTVRQPLGVDGVWIVRRTA